MEVFQNITREETLKGIAFITRQKQRAIDRESMVSISKFEPESWRTSNISTASECRRITIQGLGENNVELQCLLPTNEIESCSTSTDLQALSKEELLKLQQTLKAAQDKADSLLASFGV
jgi:hypothetical protein